MQTVQAEAEAKSQKDAAIFKAKLDEQQKKMESEMK